MSDEKVATVAVPRDDLKLLVALAAHDSIHHYKRMAFDVCNNRPSKIDEIRKALDNQERMEQAYSKSSADTPSVHDLEAVTKAVSRVEGLL